MPFNLPSFFKLFCAATVCAVLAGCSAAPPSDVANNATGNATDNTVSSTPGDNTQTVKYANSPQGLSGKLKENYVDFSFEYPTTWQLKETGQSADAQNFVKVERGLSDTSKGEFTAENFAVGYFSSTGDAAKDATLFPKLVQQLSSQFKEGFPDYKKLSEGKTKIGDLNGYEFRFQSKVENTPRGPVTLWGRAVLLPNPDNTQKGVALIMLASSLAPEIKSAADVGEKGQLPSILKSFKFEASPKKDE